MVSRKKEEEICDQVPHEEEEEDLISKLPESLISEILYHLPTRDAVRTSALSTRWRNLWQSVPTLDLSYYRFAQFHAFESFVKRFLWSNDTESQIRKLRLRFGYHQRYDMCHCDVTSWIDAVTTRRIQHLEVHGFRDSWMHIPIPQSLYTCEKLVHLRLYEVALRYAEFVSLPCLKVMHLQNNKYYDETTLQRLISGCPILEDLTIITYSELKKPDVLQVRSHTLKRIHIYHDFPLVVIDAPLLQCLRTSVSSPKNLEIVNLSSSARLDIDFPFDCARYSSSMVHDILTDVSSVRELVISNVIWKEIFEYSKSGPVLQFCHLSRLNVKFSKSDLEMLPTLLGSCPKLEFFVLELVTDNRFMCRNKKNVEPNFSTVPQCLVSSLKYVEWKRQIPGYEGEVELVRYLLKNSKILEKLKLDVYYTEMAKCAFLQELLTMPRCSTVCEVHCSVIPIKK
ncbi:F-box/FBD/LRR-repeat protein At1g51370 isoform X2 [Capsella rubella]|nr:F-box/FBD/LRR-repeat protein At1g51370 isoform X2 [Capsella rubella]XP_023643682.1 F-box/FBD/LRR-repeat protein At1g51370 isoform X2 [Capsella rubella]